MVLTSFRGPVNKKTKVKDIVPSMSYNAIVVAACLIFTANRYNSLYVTGRLISDNTHVPTTQCGDFWQN